MLTSLPPGMMFQLPVPTGETTVTVLSGSAVDYVVEFAVPLPGEDPNPTPPEGQIFETLLGTIEPGDSETFAEPMLLRSRGLTEIDYEFAEASED